LNTIEAEEVLRNKDKPGTLSIVKANAVLANAWLESKRKRNGPLNHEWVESAGFHACESAIGSAYSIDGPHNSIVLHFASALRIPIRCEIDDGEHSVTFFASDRATIRSLAKALNIKLKEGS
jgi:hypothetical protein